MTNEHSEELYEILKKSADVTGLPVMKSTQFISTTEKYGKEVFRKTLAEYITNEKPPFPLKQFSQDKVVREFHKLKSHDWTDWISKRNKEDVLEKYDDYKYPYSKYGLGVIDAPSTYNYISDSFMNELRLACGSYGFKSPIDRWNQGDNIWGVFGPIWRGINSEKDLSPSVYMSAFRLGTYIATQFKPVVAKAIYDITEAETVLDTSCGWGDRLAGFFASDAKEFYGCDPNPNTYRRYQEQIATYNKMLSEPKKVQIWNCGAEDLPYHKLPAIDVAFTSPPYFSTEEYNKGGELEENQSWFKFNEDEKWSDDFYLAVAEKSMKVSRFMFCNIMDPKIKGTRYRSGDELVNHLKDKFLGQIGMRIMQRPQGKAVFKDEDGNFSKEKLDENMNKMFIENVWCFGDKDLDLFRYSRKATLDEFFA